MSLFDGKNALNDLPALSVRRPYLAIVMNLLIMIAGFGAYMGIDVRELPDIDRPIVTVRADYPGASPETLDSEVTSVIEAAVARVNGVKEVRSSSEENNLRVRAIFNPNINLDDAATDVREAVSRVERQLPEAVENLSVIKADADAYPILSLAVRSDKYQIDALSRLVEDQIVPELTAVTGVADVTLYGDRQTVLRVKIDPMRLASYGLSVADVTKVMQNARYDVPAGSFASNDQEVLVRANASVVTPQKIEELYIQKPVRIGDVASVFFTPDTPESWVRLNGQQVISLGIVRQASSNTIAIADGVQRAVKRLAQSMPDIHIETISDDSLFIKSAISELLTTLALSILIVVGVIAIFTGQFRASLIPTLAIPVALVGSLSAIWALGFTLNLITLLAMVLATGVVVDDAIVVLENTQRLRAKGVHSKAAAVLGTRQLFFAVIATTATLISVFVPISFLPSEAGRLFQEFGFVLAVSVAISSFVALTLVPMLASKLPAHAHIQHNRLQDAIFSFGRSFHAFYERLLDLALNHSKIVIVGCLGIGILAGLSYLILDHELVPEEDRGRITVRLTGPDGVGLTFTDRQVIAVEKTLAPYMDMGVVKNLYSIAGRYDLNRGQIDAPLIDWSERDLSEGEIVQNINKKLQKIPGAQARISRGNSLNLRNADGGIELALIGADYAKIFSESQRLVKILEEKAPWFQNSRIEFRATQPELSIHLDRTRATDLGVDLDELASTIRVLIDELDVGDLIIHDQSIPILLQAREGTIQDPENIANLYVPSKAGNLIPIGQMVTFSETSVAAELDRHAQRRAIEIRADLGDDVPLQQAVDALRLIAQDTLSSDVRMIFLGQAKALEETNRDLIVVFAIALLVVFLVLLAQFESLTSTLVVMVTVPLGICAAIFALVITGTSLNIYSQIGILMLIGIMAKNAILMVEFADQLRETGETPKEAARMASLVRLRPIMMTMVSTIASGLPLILGTGAGIEARTSIGWVIFGGLGLAGIFTLFVAPAVYSLIAGYSTPRSHHGAKLMQEIAEAEKNNLLT